MSKVKGTKITSKLAFVRDTYGEEGEALVLETLGADDRERIRTALEIGWYPHDLYERVIDAVVEGPAGGDERVLDRLGEHNAERQARGAYRVYYRHKGPVAVLEGMVPMHSMFNDPGEMEVASQEEGHATISVGAPSGSNRVCRIARAFYRRSVELCGGKGVSVREVECSGQGRSACRFEVRWNGVE